MFYATICICLALTEIVAFIMLGIYVGKKMIICEYDSTYTLMYLFSIASIVAFCVFMGLIIHKIS